MRTYKEDYVRVCMVGAWTIDPHPEGIAGACGRAADVGVGIVSVDAPRAHDALGVAVLARTADVIHDLVLAFFDDRTPDARCNVVECLVPSDLHPFAFAAFAGAFERERNAIDVFDLIERRRALRAISSAGARMFGVTFELANLARVFVDIREQSARGLTIEARR